MKVVMPVSAAIFDMDGLLIDSEPLWEQAEREVFAELGIDISQHEGVADTVGLRIDMVVSLWFARQPWQGESVAQITRRITERVMLLIEQTRPLLAGVPQALALCKAQGMKIAMASASPLAMLERVLQLFELREYFDALASAEALPYSKPHPEVYLNAASMLAVDPLYCVALEDSVAGMIASKAARMRTIVVPAAIHQHDARWALADVKLASLSELAQQHLSAGGPG